MMARTRIRTRRWFGSSRCSAREAQGASVRQEARSAKRTTRTDFTRSAERVPNTVAERLGELLTISALMAAADGPEASSRVATMIEAAALLCDQGTAPP